MDELGHLGWVAHQSFELDGFLFGVRTDSKAFARWLAESLPATLVRDEEAEPNYSVVVGIRGGRLGKRFHFLYRDSTVLIRTLDASELVRALLCDLEALTYSHRRDAVYTRAMFLCAGGVDALFPEELIGMLGEAGRRIQPMGINLPASRHVSVDPESGQVVRLPQALEVDHAAIEQLVQLIPSEPTAWPRTVVDRPTTIDLLCTMGSLSPKPTQPVSRALALYVLSSNATNLSEMGGGGLEALRRLVEGAACWSISPTEAKETAESMLDLASTVAAERTNAAGGGLPSS